ncbi:MAG: ammonium transporter [Deltaproteobacteria bacterium]|nr:ammonium transporter [Deltaproteobacteria bacterium]
MEQVSFTVANLWMMIATALVFVMHLGFATLEAGLTRSKNTVNVLFKNTLIPALGLLTYAAVGFGLMYPGESFAGGIAGFGGFGLVVPEGGLEPAYNGNFTYWTDFLFQGMFAATAVTIVSGAVAERVKLGSFLVFAVIFLSIGYPVTGMWGWGGGFLATLETPFHDFAGSTLVHAVGGFAALAGALLVGPRKGKYAGGRINPVMGHSLPLATIGAFLLWLGWFGFNGGSVLSADAGAVSHVLVTTNLAAAAGIVAATLVSWRLSRKPDLSMVLNGLLAGLVAVTAGADTFSPADAVIVGALGGGLVVFGVLGLDRLRLDDPVGAISVHLLNGVWGTLAVGLFGTLASPAQVLSQLVGVLAVGAFAFGVAFAIFWVLRATVGLRVSEEEEVLGLDIGEHGMQAYDLSPGPHHGARPAAARAHLAAAPVLAPALDER